MAIGEGRVFGFGRSDATQVQAVETFRVTLVELRGGYVFAMGRGEDPVLLTERQRDVVVDLYAEYLSRSMWWAMISTLVGTAVILSIILPLDMEVHFWMVLPILAVAMVPTFTLTRSLRRRIVDFGLLPRVSLDEYSIIQRERWRERPWSSILLPALVLPFVAISLDPQFPPTEADDWIIGAFLLALAAMFVWAIARKLLAGRTADL